MLTLGGDVASLILLSLSPSLSPSLSLSSILRSAASVQGTPAAGFWVSIAVLHRQQGTRSSEESQCAYTRQETLPSEPNPP